MAAKALFPGDILTRAERLALCEDLRTESGADHAPDERTLRPLLNGAIPKSPRQVYTVRFLMRLGYLRDPGGDHHHVNLWRRRQSEWRRRIELAKRVRP